MAAEDPRRWTFEKAGLARTDLTLAAEQRTPAMDYHTAVHAGGRCMLPRSGRCRRPHQEAEVSFHDEQWVLERLERPGCMPWARSCCVRLLLEDSRWVLEQ